MRHRVAGRRLNRTQGARRALIRNLIGDLFRHN
jgi:ribosomal protein L17